MASGSKVLRYIIWWTVVGVVVVVVVVVFGGGSGGSSGGGDSSGSGGGWQRVTINTVESFPTICFKSLTVYEGTISILAQYYPDSINCSSLSSSRMGR